MTIGTSRIQEINREIDFNTKKYTKHIYLYWYTNFLENGFVLKLENWR